MGAWIARTRALFEPADLNPASRFFKRRPSPESLSAMSKIAGNEIRPGAMIEHQGALWIAVKTQAVKPGKGGAYNQVELKNIETGTKLNERFRSSEMVEEIHLDKKDFQFLFAGGDVLTFMDMESYEQIELAADFVGDQAQFLSDGMKVMLRLHDGRPLSIQLPQQVTVTVAEADPVLKGGTAAPSFKSAVLENGLKIQVPPFIGAGERIVVNTEDGSYVRRAEV
jgi:elongation factor P